MIPMTRHQVTLYKCKRKNLNMGLLNNFKDFYRHLSLQSIANLGEIYAPDAVLIDPLSKHQGLQNIKRYFENLLSNTQKCECHIVLIVESEAEIFVTWEMLIAHPRLNSGADYKVSGISHLQTDGNKVVFHRDYYDLGEMIYEQVPILKRIINMIKRRLV